MQAPEDFRSSILQQLDQLGISYECHSHAPVYSMDDCVAQPFMAEDIVFAKNLLLETPTKDRRVLLLMAPFKPFKTSVVSKLLGTSRLSFASPATMMRDMFTRPGALSPLGLLAEPANGIMLALDAEIMTYNRIAMHPCRNDETLVMPMLDFLSVLIPALRCPYVAIKIPDPEQDTSL